MPTYYDSQGNAYDMNRVNRSTKDQKLVGKKGSGGGSMAFKERQFRRDMAERAFQTLQPGKILGDFNALYGGLYDASAPHINALLAGANLSGQTAASAAMGSLARAGLGGSGMGGVIGAGLRAGGAFRGNQLRAQFLSELMNKAFGTANQNRQIIAQGFFGTGQSLPGGGQGTAGQALQALGSLAMMAPQVFGNNDATTTPDPVS